MSTLTIDLVSSLDGFAAAEDWPGRRKIAEGKTTLEALRCLRRRLSDVVYRQLVADATEAN